MKNSQTKISFKKFKGSKVTNLRTVKGGAVVTGPGRGDSRWTYDNYTASNPDGNKFDGRGNPV
jgi:hypothetical protein